MTSTGALTRYGASRVEIEAALERRGEPAYRASQVWEGLWGARRPLEDLTSLPKSLREAMASVLPTALEQVDVRSGDGGSTSKWLWRCSSDGAEVETVLMRSSGRATVCISSQAGCAMGCSFCATGQAGFERSLDGSEIVEQVLRAQHASADRIGNVVYMGMGEPLANLDAVWASIERIHGDLGISARSIVVSTVGVVPGMRRLAELPLPVTLAVSLHAPDDSLRSTLVPLNRRYPIAEVIEAARDYAAAKGRRVTFEYACIADVNDSLRQAEALARLLRRFPGGAHVNLIPLNPTDGYEGGVPQRLRVNAFAARLRASGITATVRRTRGADIDAACGQLRSGRTAEEPAAPS